MLPGFRFIIITMVLGTSVLIFGLGAAALLRATHEEFASLPSSRALQQQSQLTFNERFNPVSSVAPPTLSLLRVEPQIAAPAPITGPTNTEVASLNVLSEAPAVQATPRKKRFVRRKTRRHLVHVRRAQTRAAIVRTRTVQRTVTVDPFPFMFLN